MPAKEVCTKPDVLSSQQKPYSVCPCVCVFFSLVTKLAGLLAQAIAYVSWYSIQKQPV